jgi:sigma-B regulation protein RsbU (phosphoserine phosphatase)
MYDERRILFNLGQAARRATNLNDLYALAINEISRALSIKRVSLFVRDERTGDFSCCISTDEETRSDDEMNNARAELSAHHLLAKDALVVKRLRGLSTPLTVTARDLATWRRAAEMLDRTRKARRERECATLEATKARLLIGITMQERLIGILALGERENARSFTTEDKRMLMSVASQLAFTIENAKLVERLVVEENLRRELALAAEVQRRLLPRQPIETETFAAYGFCRPARLIGGDYYDFLTLGEDRYGLAIADVAGKGISAALLVSSIHAALRSHLMMHRDKSAFADQEAHESLIELMRAINDLVHRSTDAASYVTFFYAQFDEETRRLSFVNAGHNPPLLLRARQDQQVLHGSAAHSSSHHLPISVSDRSDTCSLNRAHTSASAAAVVLESQAEGFFASGSTVEVGARVRAKIETLSAGGMVLGLFEDATYSQDTIQLASGDLLIAYTDGLTEALNAQGEEFGEARLRALAEDLQDSSAQEACDAVVRQVQKWIANAPQHDDLTLVVLKVK